MSVLVESIGDDQGCRAAGTKLTMHKHLLSVGNAIINELT